MILMYNFNCKRYQYPVNILLLIMLFRVVCSGNYTSDSYLQLQKGTVNNITEARKKCFPNGVLASLHEDKFIMDIQSNKMFLRKFF